MLLQNPAKNLALRPLTVHIYLMFNLFQAVQLCKKVAGKLNLDILVSHLVDVHAYVGVVEIALASAQKRDPQVTTDNQTKKSLPNMMHHAIFTLTS